MCSNFPKTKANKLEELSWDCSSDEFKKRVVLGSFDNCDTTAEVTVAEMVIIMANCPLKSAIEIIEKLNGNRYRSKKSHSFYQNQLTYTKQDLKKLSVLPTDFYISCTHENR
jgi:hypothetical protein